MKIDKKFLDEQMVTFQAQREEALRNLGMVEGAIQCCEHLLKVLDMEEPKENRTPNEKGEKHGMAKGKKAGNKKATGGKKGTG